MAAAQLTGVMPLDTGGNLPLLKRPIVILGVFICFKIYQAYFSFVTDKEAVYLSWIRLGSAALLIIAAYFALKENKLALWITGTLLIINIFPVIGGLFFIHSQQYVLKLVAIILGGYFVYGGFVLIQKARTSDQVEA